MLKKTLCLCLLLAVARSARAEDLVFGGSNGQICLDGQCLTCPSKSCKQDIPSLGTSTNVKDVKCTCDCDGKKSKCTVVPKDSVNAVSEDPVPSPELSANSEPSPESPSVPDVPSSSGILPSSMAAIGGILAMLIG